MEKTPIPITHNSLIDFGFKYWGNANYSLALKSDLYFRVTRFDKEWLYCVATTWAEINERQGKPVQSQEELAKAVQDFKNTMVAR